MVFVSNFIWYPAMEYGKLSVFIITFTFEGSSG